VDLVFEQNEVELKLRKFCKSILEYLRISYLYRVEVPFLALALLVLVQHSLHKLASMVEILLQERLLVCNEVVQVFGCSGICHPS